MNKSMTWQFQNFLFSNLVDHFVTLIKFIHINGIRKRKDNKSVYSMIDFQYC